MLRSILILTVVTLPLWSIVAAAPAKSGRSEATKTLVACRALTVPEDRLACYDREVARFDEAEKSEQIFVIDHNEADATRHGLFGLTLPKLRIAGNNGAKLNRIDEVVASISRDADGRVVFYLQDGAKWHQVDDRPVATRMGSGTKVVIERAAFGSFFATFDKYGSIRVKREN